MNRSLANLKNVKIDYENDIAIVQLNQENSKVNTLSQEMTKEFIPVFDYIKTDDNIKGIVVISTKPGSFIAGADINMLESAKNRDELYQMSRQGQDIMNQIEQSTKPIVAAIAGSCLGGGFELALACHYRIAVNDKRTGFGLPEVKLGLLPGAGGTQRLLEKLLLTDALDLLLTGKEIKAKRAYELGLIDSLVQSTGEDIEYLRTVAVKKVKELVLRKSFKRQSGLIQNIKSKIISIPYLRNYIFSQAQTEVLSQTQGLYPAPLRILDVIKQTLERGSKVGYNAEAEAFADLGMTKESKALIHLFHGRTECKKNSLPKCEKEIKKIAILGAESIGAGIAQISIDKEYQVILYDTSSNILDQGEKQIEQSYENLIKRNRMIKKEYDRIIRILKFQTDFTNFEQCDMIIESSFDDFQFKENLFHKLETIVSHQCIYAFQTYGLSLDQLANNSQNSDKVIGLHYSSPVDKVELVEIIRTSQTSEQTLSSVLNLVLKQGKLALVINDSPGFYTTRLIICFSIEIFSLLLDRVLPTEIDRATKNFGFHIGLATFIDDFGIDQIVSIVFYLRNVFGEDFVNESVIELMKSLVKKNWFGKKSKQGLFIYDEKGKKDNNPRLIEKKTNKNSNSVILTTEDIQWRICLRILNESSQCLEKKILNSPSDGDIGAVFGFGFPPMKGGPFHFMDTYGLSEILTLMQTYHILPNEHLIHLSNTNKRFYS